MTQQRFVIIGVALAGLLAALLVTLDRFPFVIFDQPPKDAAPVSDSDPESPTDKPPTFQLVELTQRVGEPVRETIELQQGQTIEVSVRIDQPSQLPPNGRLEVALQPVSSAEVDSAFPTGVLPAHRQPSPKHESNVATAPAEPTPAPETDENLNADSSDDESAVMDRSVRYCLPTPSWSKLLHALDSDLYLVYRAPVSGQYQLTVKPFEEAADVFSGPRWREAGKVAELTPSKTPAAWPDDADVRVHVELGPLDLEETSQHQLFVEAEPNDTPEQAQPIRFDGEPLTDQKLHIIGGSDDTEYFDNGRVGRSGDDWFRLEYTGEDTRLLTACLSIVDQQVAARIRCYELPLDQATATPGELLPIETEYRTGKNANERVHQQVEQHRIAINRELRPGHVYFLRVEANAPMYELELQSLIPAPYQDPRRAIQRALYDHIGQVDAWLTNRPRAVSVERRIRDTGNLLGSGCMSCHTQAGVWGPAIAFRNGYRPENVQLMRNLVNLCYQSLRPTNELIDAGNNCSLAPLDLGDGPAGTRVTGHAMVAFERYQPPRALHSQQAIRAANNVLQTSDPVAVNAAGPGANVGQGVVLNYAGEIVAAAWQSTGNPQYFRAIEDKARRLLDMEPRFTDDICHRVEFLTRYFPEDYIEQAARVAQLESQRAGQPQRIPYRSDTTTPADAQKLQERIDAQVAEDLERLVAIRNGDGSWGFSPGRPDGEGGWTVPPNNVGEPSPTALALIAFHAAGRDRDESAVREGIDALLALQHPSGFWKGASLTGFVSTAYAINALSWWFPNDAAADERSAHTSRDSNTLLATLRRVRNLASQTFGQQPTQADELLAAARHTSPLVRYWAMIGLGANGADAAIGPLVEGLGDKVKGVREAAAWGLRQILIDDRGWDAVLEAARSEDDTTRESAIRALVMRVDGVLPETKLSWKALTQTLTQAMNADPHPGVRAWATRAAWNWWYWNPPVRADLNTAWTELLMRAEPEWLVENAIRYQSQALFVVNGHHANASRTHQYRELADLFESLRLKLQPSDSQTEASESAQAAVDRRRQRLIRRLAGIAATFYTASGGDGGPGQLGYSTPGANELFGGAILEFLGQIEQAGTASDTEPLQIALESAANIAHEPLQQRLIHYSLNGPEHLRTIAASSVSDPRSAQLVAVPEMIEPLVAQIHRGAMDPPRRTQLSDPLITLFRRVRWMVPTNRDQQLEILDYLIPDLSETPTAAEVEALTDPVQQAEASRRLAADEYLAANLGDVLGENPDLHFDVVLERFPEQFENPLEARFWLPSVPWIMTHRLDIPGVGETEAALPADANSPRRRAMRLYLSQLREDADAATRRMAVEMAQITALRSHPEVIAALQQIEDFETNPTILRHARNAIRVQTELTRQLSLAVAREEPRRVPLDDQGQPIVSEELLADFRYFVDHVQPELNRPQRNDQQSCFSCHGVPDRVPSLKLNRPNSVSYLSVTRALENYRLLQQRIDYSNPQRSRLLRKPLNIQTETEEGHQGGLRYRSTDRGYLILKRWVENQSRQRQHVAIETANP